MDNVLSAVGANIFLTHFVSSLLSLNPNGTVERNSFDNAVPASAKVNLFLGVTGMRNDGFHEISSVIAKINLFDFVTIELTPEADFLSCNCSGTNELNGVLNLAEQAVLKWRQKTGINTGIKLTIEKNIPLEAGLGGVVQMR